MIRCGHCKGRHATVAQVKECMWEIQRDVNEERAERAADLANERSFEDHGYWDARAEEDWETARGVIPFDVAYANAMAR